MKEAPDILDELDDYYPFTAVMGHERLKKLIFLCVINSNFGTVLVHGPKHTMKKRLISSSMKLAQKLTTSQVTKSVFINPFDENTLQDNMRKNLRKYGLEYIVIKDAEDYNVDDVKEVLDIRKQGKKKPTVLLVENTQGNLSKLFNLNLTEFYSHSKTIRDIERRIEIIKREKVYHENSNSLVDRFRNGEIKLIDRIINGRGLLSSVEISRSLVSYIRDEFISENSLITGEATVIKYAKTEAAFNGRRWVSKEDINECLHHIK